MSREQLNRTAAKDARLKDLLLERAELEFVQIIIIIVVITVMVVVIICLLNHYKLSTRSFINRQSQSRRQEETLQTFAFNHISEQSAQAGEKEAEMLQYSQL